MFKDVSLQVSRTCSNTKAAWQGLGNVDMFSSVTIYTGGYFRVYFLRENLSVFLHKDMSNFRQFLVLFCQTILTVSTANAVEIQRKRLFHYFNSSPPLFLYHFCPLSPFLLLSHISAPFFHIHSVITSISYSVVNQCKKANKNKETTTFYIIPVILIKLIYRSYTM